MPPTAHSTAVAAPAVRSPSRSASPSLLDEDFLRKLDLLEIVFRRNVLGSREGDRAGQQRGGRTEFAEHREYAPGDDLRYLDWNVYARTGRLFVKEFTKQESVLVCALVDASASMGFGAPTKLFHAKRLAAAFAYLGLVARNEAQIGVCAGGQVSWSPRYTGRPDVRGMAAFLDPAIARGPTDLLAALRAYRERVAERSLVVLITDLFDEGDGKTGLRLLSGRRHDVAVLHVLSPQELSPPELGHVRLVDSESGAAESLHVDDGVRRRYGDALNDFVEAWQSFCRRHDLRYVQTSSSTPFETTVLDCLRQGGLVR